MSTVYNLMNSRPDRLGVIAGPCVVESQELLFRVAEVLEGLSRRLPVDVIFKSSYRKANRTGAGSFTGIGDEKALGMMAEVKRRFEFPLLTDIHEPSEALLAAEVVDVLQIPAFLARQSSLLQAAAETGKVVNIKKGQFMAPQDMGHARAKISQSNNEQVWLTERGTFFGYGDLVVDFRSIDIMKEFGSPVVFDATHSVQRPSQQGVSGGDRRFIPTLLNAAIAAGVDGIFLETHPDPANALSDKSTQWPLDELEALLARAVALRSRSHG